MNREDANLRQRSKANWLKLGDSNTRFFNLTTKMRKAKNSTLRLFIEDTRLLQEVKNTIGN